MPPAATSSGAAPRRRKRVALVYPFFAHYRGPVLEELLHHSVHDFILVGDIAGQGGIELWQPPAGTPFITAPLVYWRGHDIYQRHVIGLAMRRDLDAIIYLGNPQWISTWVSAILARLLGKKVYFWTHGWVNLGESGLKKWVRRTFYHLAHGLMLYGHLAKAQGLAQGFSPSRLHVIYNSLDYPRQKLFREATPSERLRQVRLELFGETETPVVICSSRLIRVRRLDLLIAALGLLQAQGHRTLLLLVGDGPERPNLEKLASEHNLRVAFTGACYDEKRLAELTMAANVTVAPGKVGLTAMQSLAYGTPVITHGDASDQMPEWEAILPGRTGNYFRKEDVPDLADQIRKWTRTAWTPPEVHCECVHIIERFYTPAFQRLAMDRAISGYPADDLFWQR